MAIFKRIEIWLLFLIIGGAVWFVFQSPGENIELDSPVVAVDGKQSSGVNSDSSSTKVSNSKDPKTEARAPTVAENEPRFEIVNLKSVPDCIGSLLEFTISGNIGKPLELTSPNVRLVTESGDEIERFFLPFDPPPVLESEDEAAADLKYWVRNGIKEPLWLEIDGDRVAVDLEKR